MSRSNTDERTQYAKKYSECCTAADKPNENSLLWIALGGLAIVGIVATVGAFILLTPLFISLASVALSVSLIVISALAAAGIATGCIVGSIISFSSYNEPSKDSRALKNALYYFQPNKITITPSHNENNPAVEAFDS